jgi:hypothetical protein
MVIPLARARTQSRGLLEAPNQLNLNDRPQCGFRQAALSKLAVERLQRRFAALLTKATLRLNAIYIPAGLIVLLQTLPTFDEEDWATDVPGNVAGFSLHAGVAVKACQRDKLERLCRYICRPPVSEKRLFLTSRGEIGYTLKTPYRDGTTHVIFEPLDFIARLAALVPPPRLNLTRFHSAGESDRTSCAQRKQ